MHLIAFTPSQTVMNPIIHLTLMIPSSSSWNQAFFSAYHVIISRFTNDKQAREFCCTSKEQAQPMLSYAEQTKSLR